MRTVLTLYVLTTLSGLGLGVAGVYDLLGTGWAMIAGAVSLILVASVLREGLRRD